MQEKQPKISVIIPSLNVKDYIKQCVDSVINQTLRDIEILCVDAGSDDGTLEILKEYAEEEPHLNVFLSNRKSYGSQVNQGLTIATGEYISIVESDDYIKEDMLESLYKLTQYGYMDIVKGTFYHMYLSEDENRIEIDTAKRNIPANKVFKVEDQPLFLDGHPSIWSAIYKRSFLINNNIHFLEEDGGAWVDNPFFYETALKADSILYTNTPYYYYRETNQNSSSNDLQDLSIPSKRINDLFGVLDECGCDNPEIMKVLYKRLLRYVEITMENNKNSSNGLNYETCSLLNQVLSRMDEEYVHEMSNKHKQYYYKFRSPLILSQFEDE